MNTSNDKKYPPLKNVVAAVEPPVFERALPMSKFADTIKTYQEAMILPRISIVSMIHSSLYMVPLSWYSENEDRYAHEAQSKVDQSCHNRFDYSSVKVLKAKASANHFLVEHLSDFLTRIRSDLLVVLASNRKGVPYWLLGSFAETAALTCKTSVMVVKSQSKIELATKPRLTVAVDSNAKYTSKDINWLIGLALPGQVRLDLLFVRPKPSGVLSALRKPKQPPIADKKLKKFEQELKIAGVSTTLTFAKEVDSIAETIVDFSEKKKSWGIVTISTERSIARKLLLGSTARKILMLTKRPFFSIRTR
ncbi:MAG: universal stress protein [Bacteriovorax sp.]|jgi:nucleotide-binding universal stress UspA family protein